VTPTIRGLTNGMTAMVSAESVVLILNGPLAIMEHLQVTDVDVVVDLTNLMPGDYTIIPVVDVPEGVTIQNVIPEAIPVRIERVVVAPILPYR
jgi:YbbR domain-containing protein